MNALNVAAQQLRNPAIPAAHVAIDLECMACNPFPIALDAANARQLSDPANAEFWRRLAGSLRKALTML